MILIQNEHIERIPVLHLVNQEQQSEKRPLVFFIHGFTSAKENNLHYAYLLAENGFRVLLPEALYHGERELLLKEQDLYIHFWDIVLNTINDLNVLKEYYVSQNLVDEDRIGVAGTSMGGIATLGALTQYKWIKAAVSLMGMPAYEEFSRLQLEQIKNLGYRIPLSEEEIVRQLSMLRVYDLSVQPEKLEGRPLLFWHGKKDDFVPYPLAYQFYQNIAEDYDEHPEKLKFITDERAGHKVSQEGVKATIDWFSKFL
ncbi:prolyl oligopeptidase family serine peptidase [Neobacillus terrae]|uniref:prolyl oligopeptidase family serine peptidase n=1 Tax=Neobacillus terrae TaxID=3034837 RepID=UPI00140DEDF9|nr:prolyl oligopeptidase family serine peptidase [Neobacillus terrae]NHM33674.1 prolyl oligopeptidase family serine peptidase [Neobacillus terrae]